MFNKLFFIILVLAAFLLNAQNNEVTLETVNTPLSNKDIYNAFNQLGLSQWRFSCDIESGYGIAFYVEKYKKGKLDDTIKISDQGAGDYKLQGCTLFIIKEDNTVMFNTTYDYGPGGLGGSMSPQYKLYKYGSFYSKPFDNPVLKLGEMTPIYLLINDKGNIMYNDTLLIEEIIARYDQVFILKYELVKFKEIPDR